MLSFIGIAYSLGGSMRVKTFSTNPLEFAMEAPRENNTLAALLPILLRVDGSFCSVVTFNVLCSEISPLYGTTVEFLS